MKLKKYKKGDTIYRYPILYVIDDYNELCHGVTFTAYIEGIGLRIGEMKTAHLLDDPIINDLIFEIFKSTYKKMVYEFGFGTILDH